MAALFCLNGPAQAAELSPEQKIQSCLLEHDYIVDSEGLFHCMTDAAGDQGALTFYTHIVGRLGRALDTFYKDLATAPSTSSCRDYRNEFLANFTLEEQLYRMQEKIEEERPSLRAYAPYLEQLPERQAEVLLKLVKVQSFPCDQLHVSIR